MQVCSSIGEETEWKTKHLGFKTSLKAKFGPNRGEVHFA